MAGKTFKSAPDKDTAKQLAITIYHFLLEERSKKSHLSKGAKHNLDRVAHCLERVYKIKFADYVLQKLRYPLEEVFAIGYHPITVKKRIAADNHKRKGNEFMETELFKLAETEFTKALELNPRNAIYFCNRAASKVRQGCYVSATSDCNKALKLDRRYVKAYCWLGLAHILMDEPARAVRCYRKALRIEPNNQVCQANMDLINRRINRMTFKIMEPFNWCKRNIINMAHKQIAFKKRNAADGAHEPERKVNLEKYALGTLD